MIFTRCTTHSNADGYFEFWPILKRKLFHVCAHRLGKLSRALRGVPFEDDSQFFTTVATRNTVIRAAPTRENICNRTQYGISDLVTVGVVDLFEMVYVSHQQRDAVLRTAQGIS